METWKYRPVGIGMSGTGVGRAGSHRRRGDLSEAAISNSDFPKGPEGNPAQRQGTR
jgi:hypothetical protein